MYFKQFYLGCLAHASYLIGSRGEAAVIDPQRDIVQYLEEAEREGLKIKYVIETHLHADFVSGHRELAEKAGATVVFGKRADAQFDHLAADDGEVLKLGDLDLTVLETPGHTPESICIFAQSRDSSEEDEGKLFTGDTLFIGDVGRPDLVGIKGFTSQEMASMMYDSLHEKLLKLDDKVEVYPAHGAGSLCGKNLSAERSSTIGHQRKFNYALKPMEREEFVTLLTSELPEVPDYFPKDAELNRLGPLPLDKLNKPKEMTAAEVNKEMQRGAVLIDVRSSTVYAGGHIKGSLNIALSGQFASWAGTLIPIGTPIVLVASEPKADAVKEAVTRLARVGHDSVIGVLEKGLLGWTEAGFEIKSTPVITVNELRRVLDKGEDVSIIDVRRKAEFESGHIPGALNFPLAELEESIATLPEGKTLAIACASGYRSAIAKSLLEKFGVERIMNVLGGFKAWQEAEFEVDTSQMSQCKSVAGMQCKQES